MIAAATAWLLNVACAFAAAPAPATPASETPPEDWISLDGFGHPRDAASDDDWRSSFGDNLRFTVDVSARVLHDSERDELATAQFVGVDLHKVFTGNHGDWGTLTLQPYVTRLNNFASHPGFFEDGDDWELVYRIFNFNYTGLARGKLNFRIGHMELPFGLEHVINTNGTLRDYIHGRNFGVKADWGVSVNGDFPDFEYEIALTRGTGNDYSNTGDPYIVSGRIATPRSESLSVGLSFLDGDVQNFGQPDQTLSRTRYGVDAIWKTAGPFTLLGELSFGDDEGTDLANAIFEVDWQNANETWLVYSQLKLFGRDSPSGWDEAIQNSLGVRWAPDSHWSLSSQLTLDIDTFGNAAEKSTFALQVRYRF